MAKSKGNTVANATAKGTVKPKDSGFKVLRTVEVHPAQVELVDAFRGRAKPVPMEARAELADSIRNHGQQQAIQVREKPDEPGKYQAIFGNTRKLAADMLVSGYETRGANGQTATVAPDSTFKLRCEVVDCDDETAFLSNVIENAQRTNCSPIDNAINHEKLRTEFRMSDAAITKRYGYAHQATVTRLKKLLALEPEYQEAVNNGSMTQAAGFALADVEPENRSRVWLAAVDANGKSEEGIGGSTMSKAIKTVAAAIAAEKEAAANPTGAAATNPDGTAPSANGEPGSTGEQSSTPDVVVPKKSLTVKEFKDTCEAVCKDPSCPPKVAEAMGVILSTIGGEMSEADFCVYFVRNMIGAMDEFKEIQEKLAVTQQAGENLVPETSGHMTNEVVSGASA